MNGTVTRLWSARWWLLAAALLLLTIGWETDWGRAVRKHLPAEAPVATKPVETALLPEYAIVGGVAARTETTQRTLFNPTRRPAPSGQDPANARLQRGQFALTGTALAEGKTVAILARDDLIDVMVEVPESFIRQARSAGKVRVSIGGADIEGSITALIPRGDVATRNFPVKVRAANSQGFIEGMSASVWLPTAKTQNALIVSRDALISNSGRTVVFVLEGSKVRALPVAVIAYEGADVGIAAEGLKEGMQVVVKGNERLRDGQEVVVSR